MYLTNVTRTKLDDLTVRVTPHVGLFGHYGCIQSPMRLSSLES